jgi:ribA/ribD-fused uncharacterized protein
MQVDDKIYFYGTSGPFGYMSNFYRITFTDPIDGNEYWCSEQYFMYKKCMLFDPSNKTLINKIMNENRSCKLIRELGRKVRNFDQKIWDEHKFTIMLNGLRLKFQNPYIKKKLLETGNMMLYEASQYDKIWGIGFSAKTAINMSPYLYGTNLLGKALIVIRDELIMELDNNRLDAQAVGNGGGKSAVGKFTGKSSAVIADAGATGTDCVVTGNVDGVVIDGGRPDGGSCGGIDGGTDGDAGDADDAGASGGTDGNNAPGNPLGNKDPVVNEFQPAINMS